MSRRVRFGSTTDGTLDALDGQIDTGNENGNNPDNDLVIRDSTGTIVARYNESATTWQLEQPLDLQSNNVTNVGALDTETASIGNVVGVLKGHDSQTFAADSETKINYNAVEREDSDIVNVDESNDEIEVLEDGLYWVNGSVRLENVNNGDDFQIRLFINGSAEAQSIKQYSLNESSRHQDGIYPVVVELLENDTVDVRLQIESETEANAASSVSQFSIARLG